MKPVALLSALLLCVALVEAAPVSPPLALLPGLQTGEAPWRRGSEFLRERLQAIGLPALKAEGTVVHTHEHLDIFVLGRHIQIPTGVGIDEQERFIAPIHTHDQTGVLHVESDEAREFTLGQFFDMWGVLLTESCLGAHCADADHTLKFYVDGREVPDARAVELKHHMQIAIVYARRGAAPVNVPWIYKFPGDL